MPGQPTGTITFLFTDIEGSTRHWEEHPEAMLCALARHDALMRAAIASNCGVVFKTVGDAFCAAFPTALDALKAALGAQIALQQEIWSETGPIRVRMGLHTGMAQERDGDYFGPTLNRVARLQAIGHGQQTLLSHATHELVCDCLPAEVTLLDRGLHRLKDLLVAEHVWQLQHPALLPTEFPPLRSLDDLPTNLPRQMTSFIGREPEMAEVKRLLSSGPLLTLAGTGGVGKTRLALQVGAETLDDYPDGVWLLELAALTEVDLVVQAAATVLGLREEAGRPLLQTVQNFLRDRNLLLILDNCEHLLSACIPLADTLLRTCPHITILATSREPLGVAGERSWRVPSLITPRPADWLLEGKQEEQEWNIAADLMDYDACRLFVERAVRQRQEFAVTRRNAAAIVSICHRLDGIPLALELAATRVRSLSVEEVDTRLESRFRLLKGGSKTALPRHQTLRAAIDWSYDLLNIQEKLLFQRLSVFASGWTLEAAEQVSVGVASTGEGIEDWEVLDVLASLVDKSLVIAETQEETTRYRLLETVRQYARDRLAERDENLTVRARHRDYFLMLAEQAKPKMRGTEQAHWLEVLEAEHDNLRQALAFCLEEPDGDEKGLKLGAALQEFWWTRGYLSEGRKLLTAVLSRPTEQKLLQARAGALNGAGALAEMQGDYTTARLLHEESLTIAREFGDKKGIAASLMNLGNAVYAQGETASARTLYEQSLAMWQELGDNRGICCSLSNLGKEAFERGDTAYARSLFEQSLAIWQELGDNRGISSTTINLANVAAEQGDYSYARSLYEENLIRLRGLRDKGRTALSLFNMGLTAYVQGDYADARSLQKECLMIQRELGNRLGIAYSLEAFASLAIVAERVERSARLSGAAAALREAIGSPMPPNAREKWNSEVMSVQQALGEAAFAAAWEAGRAMTQEQAVALALEDVPS